jgi:superfamily II DNA or RNA helicase
MLLVPTDEVAENTKAALTYRDTILEVDRVLYLTTEEGILLPRGCARKYGMDASLCPAPKMIGVDQLPPVKLRDYQVAPVAEMTAHLLQHYGGILEAKGGTGKTVMALEIARRLGVSTLVLVHSEFLMNQWIKRISKGDVQENIPALYPGIPVGIAQQGRLDSGHDYPFVIGMVHTVVNRGHMREWADSFGLIITDEVHRYGADQWASAITHFDSKYRIGLTGTVERRDAKEIIFLAHIGRVAVKVEAETMQAKVYPVHIELKYDRRKYTNPWDRKLNYARLINMLAADSKRQEIIARLLADAANSGRKILVLSERLEQLRDLAQRLKGYHVGMYVGSTKEALLDEASKATIVLSTYQMSTTALDIPSLDSLFLVTPRADIVQATWRITRLREGKNTPYVVDFVDTMLPIMLNMFNARYKRYRANGYKVIKPRRIYD